jgi:hypothetical protein
MLRGRIHSASCGWIFPVNHIISSFPYKPHGGRGGSGGKAQHTLRLNMRCEWSASQSVLTEREAGSKSLSEHSGSKETMLCPSWELNPSFPACRQWLNWITYKACLKNYFNHYLLLLIRIDFFLFTYSSTAYWSHNIWEANSAHVIRSIAMSWSLITGPFLSSFPFSCFLNTDNKY